jgi:hypothetical protein
MTYPRIRPAILIPKYAAPLLAQDEIQIAIPIQIGQIGLPEIPALQIAISKVMNETQFRQIGGGRHQQHGERGANTPSLELSNFNALNHDTVNMSTSDIVLRMTISERVAKFHIQLGTVCGFSDGRRQGVESFGREFRRRL